MSWCGPARLYCLAALNLTLGCGGRDLDVPATGAVKPGTPSARGCAEPDLAQLERSIVNLQVGPIELELPDEPNTSQAGEGPPPLFFVECAAVVVAPRLVLTALHCVAPHGLGAFGCGPDGLLLPEFAASAQLGEPYPAQLIAVMESVAGGGTRAAATATQVIDTDSANKCQDDLAAVVLDQELPFPALPVRLEGDTFVGEELWMLGFGQTRAGGTKVEAIESQVVAIGDATPKAQAPPRALIWNTAACDRDSGGGVVSRRSGALVAVVAARDGEACSEPGTRTFGAHLPAHKQLLNAAFRAADAGPRIEEDSCDD